MIFERTFEQYEFRDQENAALTLLEFIRQLFDKAGYQITFLVAHDTKNGKITLKAEYYLKNGAKKS